MNRIPIWILFFLCTLCCSITQAQEQRFKGALTAGFNLSQIDGDLLNGFHQPGLHAGLRVNTILSERWEWGLELLFNQQGARRILNSNPASIYESIRLNMVEAPVMIHFTDWKFQVGLGLSYSRVISSRFIDVTGADITETQNLNPNLLNVVAGATFNFTDKWGLNLRWTRMLNNLRQDRADGMFIGRTISIRAIRTF
jgi:Outer membrane protein beta-barrel domain